MAVIDSGSDSAGKANVTSNFDLQVALPDASTPSRVGAIRLFSENDDGSATGTPYLYSPETDDDYRLRVSHDAVVENITFNHTAQQTNKYRALTTTMTAVEAGGFLTLNNSSITTTTTGCFVYSDAAFSLYGAQQLYSEFYAGWTNNPTTNANIELGVFNSAAATTPYTTADSVGFRLTSAGFVGFRRNNSSESATAVLPFTHSINQIYKFLVTVNEREVNFWIDDVRYGSLDLSGTSLGEATFNSTYRWFASQSNIGAAGAVIQTKLASITISEGGPLVAHSPNIRAALQGFSGFQLYPGATLTTGSAALVSAQNYLNSANPTAAVPTNTTSALVASALGGQFWETDTLAVTTDGIIQSYQMATHTTTPTVQLKRLLVFGITIDSFVQTALTGGGYVAQWSLAFGHTTVSLATAEAATTKAPRRAALGLQAVASGAVASTVLSSITKRFDGAPIVINPGEFIQVVKKKVGTAPSAGVIGHLITFDAIVL